jgi:heme-degrading monooxygenase HmoA
LIVVTNRIPVAPGWEEKFEERFAQRAHLVDQSPGFVRNEVHRPRPMKFSHEAGRFIADPEGGGYYEVKTWWRTLDDFNGWVNGPLFREAHSNRPPAEMFAGKNVLEVHEVFLSTDPAAP